MTIETKTDETSQQEKHVIELANEKTPENTKAKNLVKSLKGNFMDFYIYC